MHTTKHDLETYADHMLTLAKRAGADAACVLVAHGQGLSITWRAGQLERLIQENGSCLGLQAFCGQQRASVTSNDLGRESLEKLAQEAVAIARSLPEDPYCGLATPEQISTRLPTVECADPFVPDHQQLIKLAETCEEAALSVQGVTNSEGARAAWQSGCFVQAASNGFLGCSNSSAFSIAADAVAGQGADMVRDWDSSASCYFSDLEAADTIGRSAGQRATARLNPRKANTAKLPVIYDQRVAPALLRGFSAAINGRAIARDASFLKEYMNKPLFSSEVTIVDDPLQKRGLRTRRFDGEGLPVVRRVMVNKGVLQSWFLDLAAARQLKLEPTGQAACSPSGTPYPAASNLAMQAGARTPQELMADIESGFYVTELLGSGSNIVTGDYSQGASGFWIEKGERTYPVHEMTIAGRLQDIYQHLIPANDLRLRYGIDAPTLRVDGLMVAGN